MFTKLHRKLLLPGFSRWLPNWREYSRFSGLPARQKRGSDSYRHLGQPETVVEGLIWPFSLAF
jgi:hypothetical protein